MQENNFEKQVQQKMEELSFDPSGPVWQNVEERIRKKKERRRLVLWLLPLLLLTSGIIWWTTSNNDTFDTIAINKPVNDKQPGKSVPTTKEETSNNLNKENNTINQTEPGIKDENKSTQKVTTTDESLINRNTTSNNKEKNIKRSIIIAADKNRVPTKIKNNYSTPSISLKKGSDKHQKEKSFPIDKTNEKKKENTLEKAIAAAPSPVENNKVIVPETKNKPDTIIKKAVIKSEDSVANKPIPIQKQTNNKKAQFIVRAQVGTSGISNGLFDGFGQKSLQDPLAAAAPVNQSGAGITGGNVQGSLPASKEKRGLSFSLGVDARKKLSKKSSLTVGLHYQYYSTNINVGTRSLRDSTLNRFSANASSYYRNDNQQKDYTNKYHFIKLPVSYEIQFLNKIPLFASAGFSIGRLLSTNALLYNRTANIYYSDKSLLRKTQIEFTSGLTYTVHSNKKFALSVGPQMQFGITPIQKNSSANSQHLLTLGIATKISL